MGQPSQTGPTYGNAKHLLAFLNCLLVLYSTRRGRWCWPEQPCYNIWNDVSFHWSISAASLKSWHSPACFFYPYPHSLTLRWSLLLRESGRCWIKIPVNAEKLLRGCTEEVCGHKSFGLMPGVFLLLAGQGQHCLWCSLKILVWPSPEVECLERVNGLF